MGCRRSLPLIGLRYKFYQIPFTSVHIKSEGVGPSIKCVTLFSANFDAPPLPLLNLPPPPPPPFRPTPRHPPKIPPTTRAPPPPIFSRPSTKIQDKSPLYKFYLNCSHRFMSGLVFVGSPFCHNRPTSVTT